MTDEAVGVLHGVGSLTCTHADSIYQPDASGIYSEFTANTPVIRGGIFTGGVWTLPAGAFFISQPAMENSQIRSNDQTNAEWTTSALSAAQNITGIRDDANGACALTASGANATCIANAITAASDTHCTRWWLKRGSGSGGVDLTLNGGSTWNSVTITNDWAEYLIEQAALTNPQIGIRLQTNGDVVHVGNAECHLTKGTKNVQGSGPIFTAGTSDTTAATVYSISAQNHSEASGVWLATFFLEHFISGQGYLGEVGVLWFNQAGSSGGRMLGAKYL